MRLGIKRFLIILLSTLVLSVTAPVVIKSSAAFAQIGNRSESTVAGSPPHQISVQPIVGNDVCMGCHGTPGLSTKLPSGEILDLFVNPVNYALSIHGQEGYACVQCHTNLGDYPHPPFTATDLREVTLQLTGVCVRCHSGQATLSMDSVHASAQAAGMREAAVCADCHGSHYVKQLTDLETGEILPVARLDIPITCSRCHFTIYQKYRSSVHGKALTEEGNNDVPTCIDCHGVHNIGDPTTATFRLKSPQLCAGCHTNPELMDKYGISTNVLNTYVADFHGTTVTLFEKQSPDAETNKPVCYDCHGVHDISSVDNPQTGIGMKQNLLVRCKECHPDATDNFPSAWMSHYYPSPEHFPEVYYVDLFYKIFIPLVLGSMVALVGLDVGHSFYVKTRRGKHPPSSPGVSQEKPVSPTTSSMDSTSETATSSRALPSAAPSQPDPDTEERQNG
jgi:hypothetical protein